jgi:tRNA threonylcarbamoyladenosine biosynthesis protein TsaE
MNILAELRAGVVSHAPAETEALAMALAGVLPVDSVLALHGDLGAGKTTFVRGLAAGWDIRSPITSPTYSIYNVHQGRRQLIHMDAYRLTAASEVADLLLEDFLVSPWCIAVEWPERVASWLQDFHCLHLRLAIDAATGAHNLRLDG